MGSKKQRLATAAAGAAAAAETSASPGMRPSRPSADAQSKWRESELAAARTHPGGGHHGAPQVYWFRRVRRVEKVERIPNSGERDVTT